jgi:phytoene dehydrogenase-like protein
MVYDPEGSVFPCVCDGSRYRSLIRQRGGETAYKEWLALEAAMAPLQQGAALFPAAALRADPGIVLTAARFGPALLKTAFLVNDLTGPFSNIVDRHVTDPWLRNFIDLECFVLSGMLAKDTIAAEMAFMFMERNSGNSTIDYPIGGSEAIVAALVRAIERRGGKIMLRCKVDRILLEGGKATGVVLQQRPATKKAGMQPELIRARRAVVSNASVWDTCGLLNKEEDVPQSFLRDSMATPRTGSFMHVSGSYCFLVAAIKQPNTAHFTSSPANPSPPSPFPLSPTLRAAAAPRHRRHRPSQGLGLPSPFC